MNLSNYAIFRTISHPRGDVGSVAIIKTRTALVAQYVPFDWVGDDEDGMPRYEASIHINPVLLLELAQVLGVDVERLTEVAIAHELGHHANFSTRHTRTEYEEEVLAWDSAPCERCPVYWAVREFCLEAMIRPPEPVTFYLIGWKSGSSPFVDTDHPENKWANSYLIDSCVHNPRHTETVFLEWLLPLAEEHGMSKEEIFRAGVTFQRAVR